jgi:hypothetical protein
VDAARAVAALRAALDTLRSLDLSGLSDDELLDYARELEPARWKAAALDAPLVGELEARRLPARLSARNTAALLSGLWRTTPSEATRRTKAGRALAARRAMTGQPLPPERPELAAAATDGAVGSEHVRIVLTTLDKLPATLPADAVEQAEAILVEAARQVDPRVLGPDRTSAERDDRSGRCVLR